MNISLDLPDFNPEQHRIITCTIEGILEQEDVDAILEGNSAGDSRVSDLAGTRDLHVEPDSPSDLKRIKEKHHSVARLIASGVSQRLVANLSGYTESYVSVLLNNPAMIELVTLYRAQYGKSAEIITEKLRSIGTQALEKLETRISDMDDQALIATAKLGLDRAGHGPSSTSNVVMENHLIDHAEIARLNNEARKGSNHFIVPVRDIRAALAPPKPEEAEDAGD